MYSRPTSSETLDRQVSTLSGGQKTKLALVRLLFQAPDLLLERTKTQQEREIARLRKTSQKLRGYGATRVSQRIAVDKRIATLEVSKPTLPQTSRRIKIDFPVRQQSGQIVLRADHLSKRYGTKEVFRNISLQVERGQRRLPCPQPPDRGSRTGPGRDWSGRSPHGHCPQQS